MDCKHYGPPLSGGGAVSETIGGLHRAFTVGPSCVEIVNGTLVFNWNTLAKILDEEHRAGQFAMRERAAKLSEAGESYEPGPGRWVSTAAECSGECRDDIAKGIRALAPEEPM